MSGTWRDAIVPPDASIREAMRRLDAAATQILLVADADGRLLGTVTDGDIRRAILRQDDLEADISRVMNPSPVVARAGEPRATLVPLMRERHVHQLPLLDAEGRLAGLELIDRFLETPVRANAAVLMAGGLGTRLRPLTDSTPKPLLDVGGRPLLERTMVSLIGHGFRRFYLSVNYLADRVEAHFGDGSRWGVEVRYLRETEPLGTAGALSLLPEPPVAPVLVMNGDILTRLHFGQLVDFHDAQRPDLTMCIRQIAMQVPYGVVDLDEHRVVSITEKPQQYHFVNAGIYVVQPAVIAGMTRGGRLDMTELAQGVGERGGTVAAFPIREFWLDVGRVEDLERARAEFGATSA